MYAQSVYQSHSTNLVPHQSTGVNSEHGQNDDRNSRPSSNGVSTRELLANAFDAYAQTPKEKRVLQEYRDNISKVDSSAILDFTVVKSAYTKEALQNYLNENSILYIDPNKKRTDSWLSRTRLSLPVGENRYGSIRKIAYVDGIVKVQIGAVNRPMICNISAIGLFGKPGNNKSAA